MPFNENEKFKETWHNINYGKVFIKTKDLHENTYFIGSTKIGHRFPSETRARTTYATLRGRTEDSDTSEYRQLTGPR